MRGNRRLVQGMAVAGATGVLVCTVAFSQPQIMQTEETIKITENGTAGIMTTWSQKEEPEATIEKLDIPLHANPNIFINGYLVSPASRALRS